MDTERDRNLSNEAMALLAAAALVVVLFLLVTSGVFNNGLSFVGAGITFTSVILFLTKVLLVVYAVGLAVGVFLEGKRLIDQQNQEAPKVQNVTRDYDINKESVVRECIPQNPEETAKAQNVTREYDINESITHESVPQDSVSRNAEESKPSLSENN